MATSTLRGQPTIVLVVIDGSRALDWNPLFHTFKHVVQPGEKLIILGIIDRIPTLLGCKKATVDAVFNATNNRELANEIKRVSHIFERELQPFAKCCDIRQVWMEYIIDTGASFRGVLLHQATELHPRCIVLGRHLKSQKTLWAENWTCDVLLMNKKGEACIVTASPTRTHST